MKSLKILFDFRFWGILLVLQLSPNYLFAQNTPSVSGKVLEAKNQQPLPFATICLFEKSDTGIQQITGAISDGNGNFKINHIKNGYYKLQVTSIGYKKVTKWLEVSNSKEMNAGTFFLQDSLLLIPEALIVADRLKGKSETDKTTYFINDKMLSAAGNSPDLLRHIPGVQVDLKQNITLEGNSNILLFVDGKERDKSYVSQLKPSQIIRIEVLNTPPSIYDGNVSGVINIVLKKEKTTGLSGHIFSEIPTSKSVVYLFPAYSLNYNHKKINLYTSYNGEINYEDIDEITNRRIFNNASVTAISSVQQVRQKNLSHKFHYGMDYHLTDRDILNFYGFYNQYSYEQDGSVEVNAAGNDNMNWKGHKEETDNNRNIFNSVYYKHLFDDEGREIAIDVSNAYMRSENKVTYSDHPNKEAAIYTNTANPNQTTSSLKIDFSTPLLEKFKLNTGAKLKFQDMQDRTSDGFSYNEQIYALYGTINYKKSNFDLNIGLRVENAKTEANNQQNNSLNSFLPYAAFHYKVNKQNDLYLSFRTSLKRPSVYLLNQYTHQDDPYTISKGNPLLKPEMNNRLQLEHTLRFKGNYISSSLFYETKTDAINKLTYLNDNNLFVTQPQNLGSIQQYGLQLRGALKIGMLTVSPSLSLYRQSTSGNSLAKHYGTGNKSNLVLESGISSILSFKNDYALSVIFQFETAKESIQGNTYDDALYFISLDKTFKNKLKIGIVSALPFAGNYIYQGSEIDAPDFSSNYTGNLKLPAIPLMFRVSYQFEVGMQRASIKRETEKLDTRPRQGF
ncbi:MAG: TonB-dependent receptor [Bacteroidales bacterium]|nr:TonB-dependent receptor [Bacteroidales bacterium]MCF8343589.1 TonB-dependent receptor [Bacteroidales bacterium]MCF8351536.1 TonB-dependent receptor [Bacteroidales bacterium]MCF8377714.1 TonB-dependent receptor [Bacteroidales bacterium]MCF8402105.1 TonB-dependent receptor [Bacteroidales bacterium]